MKEAKSMSTSPYSLLLQLLLPLSACISHSQKRGCI